MNRLTATILLITAMRLSAQTPQEPSDLTRLRESWQRALQQAAAPLDKKYLDALTALKLRYTKEGKLQEALAIDTEMKALASRAQASQPLAIEAAAPVRHKWAILERSNFATAKQQAEKKGVKLPMLKTEADQSSFMRFFKTRQNAAAWLDASFDAETQKWVWGDGTPITYFNWAESHPVQTKGAAIEILSKDGTWRSTDPGRGLETVVDERK
jgi:hypothetical protein